MRRSSPTSAATASSAISQGTKPFEIPADELESKAVADPYAAVRVDTAIARHALPPGRLVSGLVYDVNTGLIEIVDPATGE